MTRGDYQAVPAPVSPLRQARRKAGWTKAAAIRRFIDAVKARGVMPPEVESLERMFSYWESGRRAVTVPAYQEAFCAIYGAPPAALGFSFALEPAIVTELDERLELVDVDEALVELLETHTQHLRLLDRRLGSTTRAAMAEAHAEQLADLLHRSVGPHRKALAAAAAEACLLAGWMALDRSDIKAAWDWHSLARSAAIESGSADHIAHAYGQQAIVLLDAGQTLAALDAAQEASRVAAGSPPILRAWMAATEAEVLSANGDSAGAARRFNDAARHLARDNDEAVPFVMLTESHLERWRGHALVTAHDPAAIEVLTAALAADGDSVRASASLHTDLAIAVLRHADRDAGWHEAGRAAELAHRSGSTRQAKRLRAALETMGSQEVKETDKGA